MFLVSWRSRDFLLAHLNADPGLWQILLLVKRLNGDEWLTVRADRSQSTENVESRTRCIGGIWKNSQIATGTRKGHVRLDRPPELCRCDVLGKGYDVLMFSNVSIF